MPSLGYQVKQRMTFDEWMIKVETHLVKLSGMPSGCLPDYCYRDAFNDDTPSWDCAKDALAAARDY